MMLAGNTTHATLTDLSAGKHNLTVYAWDVTGNVGASEMVTFSVAEPFPLVPVAAVCAAIAAVTAGGLYVYFKKRKHQRYPPL